MALAQVRVNYRSVVLAVLYLLLLLPASSLLFFISILEPWSNSMNVETRDLSVLFCNSLPRSCTVNTCSLTD